MTLITAFILGLLAGVIPKGIHIHVHKEQPQTIPQKDGYNESMANLLPNEVKEYYNSNNGFNRF